MNALAADDFEAAGLLALARLGELVAGVRRKMPHWVRSWMR